MPNKTQKKSGKKAASNSKRSTHSKQSTQTSSPKTNPRSGTNFVFWAIILVIIGIGAYFLYQNRYMSSPVQDAEYVDEELSVNPDQGITSDDILDDPETYEGMTVTVRAEVETWINSRAFALDAPGIVNDNLLVITRDPTYVFEDPETFGDAIWEVRGRVERFTYAQAVDSLDADLSSDLFAVYEGAPYIIADSVELYKD